MFRSRFGLQLCVGACVSSETGPPRWVRGVYEIWKPFISNSKDSTSGPRRKRRPAVEMRSFTIHPQEFCQVWWLTSGVCMPLPNLQNGRTDHLVNNFRRRHTSHLFKHSADFRLQASGDKHEAGGGTPLFALISPLHIPEQAGVFLSAW